MFDMVDRDNRPCYNEFKDKEKELIHMDVITQMQVAERFRQDGKRWALTANDVAYSFNFSLKKAQYVLNAMEKEGYLLKRSNAPHTEKGETKLYFLTTLGEKIFLT